MKKFLLLLLITSFSTNVLADKILKNGFLSGEWKIDKTFKVENPKNKIVLIYNHGSAENDKPSKNCQWKNNVRNFASLSGKKINDKEVLVYNFCTDNPGGDDWKVFWKGKDVKYNGIPKLEKRVESNYELIEKFINSKEYKNAPNDYFKKTLILKEVSNIRSQVFEELLINGMFKRPINIAKEKFRNELNGYDQ